MTNKNGAKGALFARKVVEFFRAQGLESDKIPLAGALDESDVVVRIGGLPFVFEVKDVAKVDLSGWCREAAIEAVNYATRRKIKTPHFGVIHKKRGAPIAEAYVTLPFYEYVRQISPPL